jgi:hypothetical protein
MMNDMFGKNALEVAAVVSIIRLFNAAALVA